MQTLSRRAALRGATAVADRPDAELLGVVTDFHKDHKKARASHENWIAENAPDLGVSPPAVSEGEVVFHLS